MKKFVLILCVLTIGTAAFCEEIFKLDNGQTVVIEEIHTNPIVTIDTWVKTGSINETDENNGVSHFLEHLFFKGTTNHPTGEFDKVLEAKGAINNAATSKDFTHYYITIPSKDFDLALEMHADMLQNPLIPRKELEKERKVVLEEISKDINSPSSKVYNNLIEMMYINHPYKRKVIGTNEIIETITRDEILDYFNTYYAPSNMITVITGDVNAKDALQKVKESFNSEYKKVCKKTYPKEKPLPSLLRKIEGMQTLTGYMLIGFRTVDASDKDIYALDVLATILGEGNSSVLYQNIKDKKQLAFNISASNASFKDDGIFYVSSDFIPENYERLEQEIFLQIAQIQKNGVTPEQVKTAQNIIERDTYYSRESVSNIAQEIGYTYVITGDSKFYKNYVDNIKKVTATDVKKVANKYLGVNKAAISVILPEKTNEVKVSNVVYNPPKLVSENSSTQKYELSNGATMLFTPNDSNEIVAISIFAKGGEFLEKIPGTGKLTAASMMKGTKKFSALDISQIMEDNGIKIVPTSGADTFNITVLTTKGEFDKTLEILDEIVNNASFDDYEIEKVRAEKINSIKKNRDLPLKRAIEEYNTLIYQGSVYSNSTKILEKTYPKVTRDDIIEFYGKIFEPKNMVISVNGNVDKEKTLKAFSQIFSPKNQEVFDNTKYTVPIITSPRISEQIDKTTQTDWVFLGWQTDGIQNRKDYATLNVINSLLGSGMSSRLFKNLRDEEGLAYQLGSSYSPSMRRGNFVVYIGTNPQTLEHSKSKLLGEINRLKTEYVGDTELQEAKDKLLGQYIISLETNLEKASTIGKFEVSNRGYDFDYAKLIQEVTESDVLEVANKYFNNNYVLSVVKK